MVQTNGQPARYRNRADDIRLASREGKSAPDDRDATWLEDRRFAEAPLLPGRCWQRLLMSTPLAWSLGGSRDEVHPPAETGRVIAAGVQPFMRGVVATRPGVGAPTTRPFLPGLMPMATNRRTIMGGRQICSGICHYLPGVFMVFSGDEVTPLVTGSKAVRRA